MAKKIFFLLIVFSTLLFVRCKREPLNVQPSITHLSDFESNDGVISLNISGGKAPYTIQWSGRLGDTLVSNLAAGFYYVTVTDVKNNSLVDTIEVTQPKWPVCVDVEGNSYQTAIVGNQIWMIENLRTVTNNNGDTVKSFVYNDSVSNAIKYGRLYTWHAAMNDSINENSQGICPDGWRVPSDEDWSMLIDNISTADKEIPNIKKALNLSYAGFYNNGYHGLGTSVSFWTSTQANNNAWKRYFNLSLSKAFRYHENKQNAISVRCVKDAK